MSVTDTARAATYTDLRIIGGVAGNVLYAEPDAHACGTDYWHCDEVSPFTGQVALDLHPTDGNYNKSVWFQSFPVGPNGYAYAVASVTQPGSGFRPAVKLHFWIPKPNSSTGTWVGWENYVQIIPSVSQGANFYTSQTGWTVVQMGTIASPNQGDPAPCSAWTGPHLRQSGGTGPNIFTNWGGLGIYPASDVYNNDLHRIVY
jgi:hypothetical protein